MEGHTSQSSEATLRLACRRVVYALKNKYSWVSPQVDSLIESLFASAESKGAPTNLEWLAYSVVLHEACRQAIDETRRNEAYTELFQLLFRSAFNRWPELAQDATQRALLLVYQQIDRCRDPGSFTGFVLIKLRQAFTDEQRARGTPRQEDRPSEELLEEITPSDYEAYHSALLALVMHKEGLQALLKAITRLPQEHLRQVLVLKYFEGLSDELIAARLGITAGYVRVLRHRAVTRLRQDSELRDYFDRTSL